MVRSKASRLVIRLSPRALRFHQLVAETVRQPPHHFILQRMNRVRDILLEPIRPNMRAGLRVDQLRVDANAALVAAGPEPSSTPTNPEFPPDLPRTSTALALER